MTLLSVQDLALDLPLRGGLLSALNPKSRRTLQIFADVSFTLNPGETLGLVGESGSGKTTLARALLGLTATTNGSIHFEGHPRRTTGDFAAMRRDTAMMFQDAIASLSPRMTIGALLAEPLIIHGQPAPKIKIAEMLALVGLPPDFATRYPHELSGGQARRVGVARALVLNPKLVIADEPTAGLDVSVQGEILNLMTDLKTRLNLSYLIISHNLAMVRHVSDRIAVMYLGRLVEIGPTRETFARPLHPYSQSLIASEPLPDPRKRRQDLAIKGEIPSLLNRPKACVFQGRCPHVQPICRTDPPNLREISPQRFVRCHLATPIGALA
ncbi:ABC transporter ATP-binding protein [Cypionkella aquatica]|uniref:Glutathione import ATP-binding protein GsiA n=1 Tax=Cypionkella aquatica TaxID=1756042 RepID=A0AA37U0E5_9RHOB|nr:ABC transporter ATP-binding protein [Cypionkella aquatica]GLS88523.1 ABC transporter ATP-binding protein [Cypionkella aquatica]